MSEEVVAESWRDPDDNKKENISLALLGAIHMALHKQPLSSYSFLEKV